jgi:hypothetical protein
MYTFPKVFLYQGLIAFDRPSSAVSINTPSPWWCSRSHLQRCGFDEHTPHEEWAALRMLVPMPPSKQFNRIYKLN